MSTTERIVLGEILGAHGVKGELRVRVSGDDPTLLAEQAHLWLGRAAQDPEARRVKVLGHGRAREGLLRLRIEGVASREAASALSGTLLLAPASVLPELPEGEFYWLDLIGCRVESAAGEQAGVVREIWETGAHDVLVVEDEEGRRRLVPTAAALLEEIDLEARRIVVVDLPGLLEPI